MDRMKDNKGWVRGQWLVVVVVIVTLVVLSRLSEVWGHENPGGAVDYCGYVTPGIGTHQCPPDGTPIVESPPTDENGNCRCYHAHPSESTTTPTPTPTATTTVVTGNGGPGAGGDSPAVQTPTPTATPTITPLAIGPEATPVPTAAPSLPLPPMRGVNTPTPEPTRLKRFESPCLIQHPGAPLNLCRSGNGWRVYYFGHGGQVRTGPFVPRWGGAEDKIFFATVSPTTGKPVLAQWIADRRVVRIITYYDHFPHASHKPYLFDIMPDGTVVHRVW